MTGSWGARGDSGCGYLQGADKGHAEQGGSSGEPLHWLVGTEVIVRQRPDIQRLLNM